MKPYEGTQPFVFISYAHRDKEIVLPVIEVLSSIGFRVWYDAGIEVGADWPEYIGTRLRECKAILAFVSSAFDKSPNCRREISLGISKEKSIVAVYLEEFELSAGMELQLGTLQSLYYFNSQNSHEKLELLIKSLAMIKDLLPCYNQKINKRNNNSAQTFLLDPIPLKDFFAMRGLQTVDFRYNNGCLWILGSKNEIDNVIEEAKRVYGIEGGYASGKATNYKPAWWTKSPL